MFQIRTTKPEAGNKFYIRQAQGGYSPCIFGNPTDAGCNVLANCVGYAIGRFNEIIGSMRYPGLNGNAETFITKARNLGLTVTTEPTPGGIMVWSQGIAGNANDGAGHVAICEKVIDNNTVYTSESNYGGAAFLNATRKNNNGRWGLNSTFTYLGCIKNPAVIYPEPAPEPTPQPTPQPSTFNIGDRVIINGDLYVNANASSPSGHVTNKVTNITRYAANTAHPYNTTGDLGWMNTNDIKLYTEPTPVPTPTYTTYTVQTGDNLSTIARRYGTTWQKIYEDNKSIIGANPNLIYPGQVLTIK